MLAAEPCQQNDAEADTDSLAFWQDYETKHTMHINAGGLRTTVMVFALRFTYRDYVDEASPCALNAFMC